MIFMVRCPLAAAAVVSCTVQGDRWIAPHLAVRTLFDYDCFSCRVTQPVLSSPRLPLGCLLLIRVGCLSLKSLEVQRVWEVYDDRLQFTSRQDALLLGESLNAGDLSGLACLVWRR